MSGGAEWQRGRPCPGRAASYHGGGPYGQQQGPGVAHGREAASSRHLARGRNAPAPPPPGLCLCQPDAWLHHGASCQALLTMKSSWVGSNCNCPCIIVENAPAIGLVMLRRCGLPGSAKHERLAGGSGCFCALILMAAAQLNPHCTTFCLVSATTCSSLRPRFASHSGTQVPTTLESESASADCVDEDRPGQAPACEELVSGKLKLYGRYNVSACCATLDGMVATAAVWSMCPQLSCQGVFACNGGFRQEASGATPLTMQGTQPQLLQKHLP